MPAFAQCLIAWQHTHGRHDLPWQGADAYRVWLSEIMLQQTQVATVIPYYQRFITSFPTIAALAAATEDQVLAHWSGLGYYARGRNLHKAAQIIAEKHCGEFPREFAQILELPGIGRSTAAAICALAYHERRAILDGNVKRVLARYCGIGGWAGEKKVEEKLWQQAEALLPPRDVAIYTQALMDMGATVCTRSRPKCVICPVQTDCVASQTGCIAELPAPRPKKAVPERHATFLLMMHGNDVLLEKRPGTGIWGGLWCLPQFDTKAAALAWCAQQETWSVRPDALTGPAQARHGASKGSGPNTRSSRIDFRKQGESSCETLPAFAHTFTHFKLHITPVLLRVARKPQRMQQPGCVWLDVEDTMQAAIPAPMRNLFRSLL